MKWFPAAPIDVIEEPLLPSLKYLEKKLADRKRKASEAKTITKTSPKKKKVEKKEPSSATPMDAEDTIKPDWNQVKAVLDRNFFISLIRSC